MHGLVDRPIECGGVGEGLMGEMMRLEVTPDGLDVVQLRACASWLQTPIPRS